MALFGRKKKTEEVVEEVKAPKKTTAKKAVAKKETTSLEAAPKVKTTKKSKEATETVVSTKNKFAYRITEKATKLSEKNVYVLNVPKEINKTELEKELASKYKVTVLGINIVNSPKKAKNYRGRAGEKGGGKKAYITLKAGDSIVL